MAKLYFPLIGITLGQNGDLRLDGNAADREAARP